LTALSVVLAFIIVAVDEQVRVADRTWLPLSLDISADGARGMVSVIAGSMLSLAGIAFSSTLVVLSLSASTYTPRVLRNFTDDRSSQTVLGSMLATFVYCLLVLRTIQSDEPPFVPVLATAVAVLFALIDLGLFIYFIHHIAESIQVAHITANIAHETKHNLDKLVDEHAGAHPDNDWACREADRLQDTRGALVPSHQSGYIVAVEMHGLLDVAVQHNLQFVVEHDIGDFIAEGAPLVSVYPAAELDETVAKKVRELFILGSQRTLHQDPAFGVRQLVDIAIKALSPAVNDVTTAVNCLDYIGDILRHAATCQFPSRYRGDHEGRVRIVIEVSTFESYLDLGFDQIRVAGQVQVAVVVRMLEVAADLALIATSSEQRDALARHADLIRRAADASLKDVADREKVDREAARLGVALSQTAPASGE